MKILLNELEKANGLTLHLEGPIDLEGIQIPGVQFRHFNFTGHGHKEAGLVVVEGTISGVIETSCSKCIAPTEYPFSTSFLESFSENETEEDSDIHTFQNGKIELTPYFQETILLEIPQTYLCGDACKGLCPTCGTDWNKESCTCNNERIDPRLADLALFFQKGEKS